MQDDIEQESFEEVSAPESEQDDVASEESTVSPTYFSVIIGTGPIGLLSALTVLNYLRSNPQYGKIALVADRRDELGVRQQVLWIEQPILDYIKSHVGNPLIREYMSTLAITSAIGSGYYITTGDLEHLLYRALTEQFTEGEHYDFIESKKIERTESPTEAIQVDLEQASITIRALKCNGEDYCADRSPSSVTLPFKFLITADGTKRSVVSALGEKEVFFDETQAPLHHAKHIVATFQLPPGMQPSACEKARLYPGNTGPEMAVNDQGEQIEPRPLAHLQQEFGWQGETRPHSQIYATGGVVYIGAEIPPDLPRDKAREYALTLMLDTLPKHIVDNVCDLVADPNTSFGKKRLQLAISIFDIELGEINRTALPCGDTSDEENVSVIFFMGDARKNPLYTTGSGVQTGILEVMYFNEFLRQIDNNISISDNLGTYHAMVRETLLSIMEKQDNWVKKRYLKDDEAKRESALFKKYHKGFTELANYLDMIRGVLKPSPSGSEGDSALPAPICLQRIEKKLGEIKEKYQKTFMYCCNLEQITSYNGMHIEELLKEIDELADDIRHHFPTKEDAFSQNQELGEFYDAFFKYVGSIKGEMPSDDLAPLEAQSRNDKPKRTM